MNKKNIYILIIFTFCISPIPAKKHDLKITINIKTQKLLVSEKDTIIKEYPISSSKYGTGSKQGSNKTPIGLHRIYKKIGTNAEIGAIFRARKNTSKISPIYKDKVDVKEDLVTTRILWLEGLEKGKNKGGSVDSRKRYIYIHGTPEEGLINTPSSHGCIRMKNKDVIELYGLVPEKAIVNIKKN